MAYAAGIGAHGLWSVSRGLARGLEQRSEYKSMMDYADTPREGEFDALMTLAQLPVRSGGHWALPCVDIEDAPSMRWRVVSDDVSRGPFPTMEYAKRRIKTLASLKINGWSPYMEQVFADPRYPFVAWPNAFTAAQLRELTEYALRFHVTLIPEQQTFAHMHETLKWEQLAPLAELPHGYLVAETDPATYRYLEPLVRSVADAAKPAPFVHIGADEPLDLGRGRTPRTPQAFADHVKRVASFLAGGDAWMGDVSQEVGHTESIAPGDARRGHLGGPQGAMRAGPDGMVWKSGHHRGHAVR